MAREGSIRIVSKREGAAFRLWQALAFAIAEEERTIVQSQLEQ